MPLLKELLTNKINNIAEAALTSAKSNADFPQFEMTVGTTDYQVFPSCILVNRFNAFVPLLASLQKGETKDNVTRAIEKLLAAGGSKDHLLFAYANAGMVAEVNQLLKDPEITHRYAIEGYLQRTDATFQKNACQLCLSRIDWQYAIRAAAIAGNVSFVESTLQEHPTIDTFLALRGYAIGGHQKAFNSLKERVTIDETNYGVAFGLGSFSKDSTGGAFQPGVQTGNKESANVETSSTPLLEEELWKFGLSKTPKDIHSDLVQYGHLDSVLNTKVLTKHELCRAIIGVIKGNKLSQLEPLYNKFKDISLDENEHNRFKQEIMSACWSEDYDTVIFGSSFINNGYTRIRQNAYALLSGLILFYKNSTTKPSISNSQNPIYRGLENLNDAMNELSQYVGGNPNHPLNQLKNELEGKLQAFLGTCQGKITNKVPLHDKDEKEFKQDFIETLYSKNHAIKTHHHPVAAILANIAIALTGIGFLVLVARFVHEAAQSKHKFSMDNVAFFSRTKTGAALEKVERRTKEMVADSDYSGRKI